MKVQIVGDAMVLAVNITKAEMNDAKQFAPEFLNMYNEETNEVMFAMDMGDTGSISKYGVTFTSENNREQIETTVMLPTGMDLNEKREYVRTQYGRALMLLKEVETNARAGLASLASEMEEIDAMIENGGNE